MKLPWVCRRLVLLAGLAGFGGSALRAEWRQDDRALAWRVGDQVVWQFSFDASRGKPFFHPLGAVGGPSLTNFRPEDHPWHYGLWFSWKYINGVNYWEEDRKTGKAQGATRWTPPVIAPRPDGGATVRLTLSYVTASGQIDLTEVRVLEVSAPDASGGYAIDWQARFTAGPAGAVLDRTPLPGEPKGQANGGYAGLSLRMAGPPLTIAFLTTQGLVTEFARDRARPSVPAVACNFAVAGQAGGGVAILSDPANAGENAPWYLIHSAQMRFACAAVLAPKPLMLPAGGTYDLRYRVVVSGAAWTPGGLQVAWQRWRSAAR
jgi:hypothetical protein